MLQILISVALDNFTFKLLYQVIVIDIVLKQKNWQFSYHSLEKSQNNLSCFDNNKNNFAFAF